jgi:WD40 repeat protein
VQLTVLGQHTGQVAGVALAPDNRSAVTVGARSAILWDLSEPTKPTYVASLFDNTNIVSAAAYSPDSSTVATASWDGTARLWNVDELRAYRTGDLRPVEAGDTTLPDAGSITGAVLSPDAQTLLTTNIDGTNRLWDLHDPATVRPRGSLPTGTGDVAFNNDATTLIAAQTGTNPSVSVWGLPDLASPQRLATLGSGPVDALALSGDGRRAVTTAGSTATLWNLDVVIGPEQAGTIHDDKPITAATYTPDGKTLVLGHDSGDISVWAVADPTRPAKTRTLTGPARPVEHIALTADGTRAVSVNQGGGVAAWNLADAAPRPAATMQPSGHGTEAAWLTPAADLALLADDDDPGTLWSWRSPNGPQRWLTLPYRHVGPLPSMLSADATTAVTVSSQGGLTIWTLRSILAVVDNPRQRACELTQGLTQEQWRHAVGAVPYRATC